MFPQNAALSGGLAGGLAFLLTSVLSTLAVSAVHPQSAMGLALMYGALLVVLVVLVACTVFVMRPGGRAMAAG